MSKASDTFLANCAELILNATEEEKSQLCDLKFVCSGDADKVFNSYRLLFIAISPDFMKEILIEGDENSLIVLPEEITYETVLMLHQCLLLTSLEFEDQEHLINSSLPLIELLQIDLKSESIRIVEERSISKKDEDQLLTTKPALKCMECGKEYVNEKSYLNHAKIHEQEYEVSLNPKVRKVDSEAESPNKSTGIRQSSSNSSSRRSKREVLKPKRFLNTVTAFNLEDEFEGAIRKIRPKTKGTRFSCEHCLKVFSSRQSLENHVKLHNDDRAYTCGVCSKQFVSESSLYAHTKLHTGKALSLKCPHCEKCLNSASNLTRHIRNRHFELSDQKLFPCQTCGRTFKDPSGLTAHEKIHTGEKKHGCDTCAKSFLTNARLKVHQRIHTGERPFTCDQCKKGFITKDHLNSHKLHRHVGVVYEKNHLCPECGVSFVKAYDLKVHLLKHLGETPYNCAVCSKAFRSERNLKTHMLVHNDEKSYNCETCGKMFRSQSGLKQHIKNTNCQHSEIGDSLLIQQQETETPTIIQEQSGNNQIRTGNNQIIIKLDKDAEHYFQLEDGQFLRADDSLYTIKDDDGGETKVAII